MDLNLATMIFPEVKNQIDLSIKVLRPFVSVFIPLYNIGYTLFSLFVLAISLLLIIYKHLDLEEVEAIVKISKIEPVKRGTIGRMLSIIRNLALVWLAWWYGAHYMAFLVFAMMILGRLFTRAVNDAIEVSKNKAVQIIERGGVNKCG
jgi:hypothetical protein